MEKMECCVPPGFRFHPTEEELVGYYLKRKINSEKIDLDVIVDIDLYRMEPWDIQVSCRQGQEEQNEWYFFSHKDRKYPTGTRTNRATGAGFWKATGRDKAVVSKNSIIGMRKTLVFYKGRAPNGRKTDWIMHEYRLQSSQLAPPQEEGWVVCRAFRKPSPIQNQGIGAWNHHHHHLHHHQPYCLKTHTHSARSPSFSDFISATHRLGSDQLSTFRQPFDSNTDQQHDFPLNYASLDINQLVELPNLDSPTLSTSFTADKPLQNSGNLVELNVLDDFLSSPITETSSYLNFSSIQSQSDCGYGSFIDL